MLFLLLCLNPHPVKSKQSVGFGNASSPLEVVRAVAAFHPIKQVAVVLPQEEDDAGLKDLVQMFSVSSVRLTMLDPHSISDHHDWNGQPAFCSCDDIFFLMDKNTSRGLLKMCAKPTCKAGLRMILLETRPETAGETVAALFSKEDKNVTVWAQWDEAGWPRRVLNETDFSGHKMRVAYDTWHPFFFKHSSGDFEGIIYGMVSMIAAKLNISLHFVPNRDPGIWGFRNADGNWNGMVKMLIEEEADMSAAGFYRDLDRAEIIDFSITVTYTHDNLFVRRMESNRLSLANYFYEFTTWNWLLILLTCSAVVLGFVILLRHAKISNTGTLALSIVLRGMLYKGTAFHEKRLSIRMLLFAHLVFVTIIVISYRSCMNGFLTVSKPVLNVRNLEDVEANDMKITFWSGGPLEAEFLRADASSTQGKLYQKFKKDKQAHVYNYEGVLQNILDNEKYVGIAPSRLLHWYPCEVLQVPNFVYRRAAVSLAFLKGSKFLAPFNREIMKMKQEGIIDRLVSWHLHTASRDECEVLGNATSLTFDHVFTPFAILLLGVLLSLMAGAFEKFFLADKAGRSSHDDLRLNVRPTLSTSRTRPRTFGPILLRR